MKTLEERVAVVEAKLAAMTQPRKLIKFFNPERANPWVWAISFERVKL